MKTASIPPRKPLWTLAALSAALLGAASHTHAQDSFWGSGSGNWSTGFAPPLAANSNMAFGNATGGNATNDIAPGTVGSVGSITFNSTAGAYTLAANPGSAGFNATTPLALTGPIANNSGNTQTLNLALTLNGTLSADAAAGNIALGGVVSGTGGLTKNGTGTLTLTGANTYTGTTTINAGTLQVGNGGTGGSIASNTIANNADLVYNSASDGSTTISLPAGITGTGNLSATGGRIQFGGNITQGGSQTFNQSNPWPNSMRMVADTTLTASSITMNGLIGQDGANSLNLALNTSATNGAINLALTVAQSGRYYGINSFTANAGTGTLNFTGNPALWGVTATTLAGALNVSSNFSPGTLNLNATGASSVTGAITFGANTTNTWTVSPGVVMAASGVLAGSNASITKNGNGTLLLSNAANTYNGSTTVNAGTLAVSGNISSSAITLNTGAVVSAGNATSAAKFTAASLAIGAGAGYAFTIGNVNSSVAGTDYDQIALGGALALNSTAASPFTISLHGTPAGWNNAGIYIWDIITAASQAGFSAGNFTTDFANFGIAAGNRTGTWSFSNPSAGIVQLGYSGSAGGNSSWNTGTGQWNTAAQWAENTVPVNFNNLTFNGTGGTATNNIGNSTLAAVNNIAFATGAGAYTLDASADSAGAGGGAPLLVVGTIANNSTAAQTLNTALGFASTRTVDAASGNIAIGGVVSGSGGLVKTGAHTLLLTAANTYTGTTTINAGTLRIGNGTTGSIGSTSSIVNNGDLIFNKNEDFTIKPVAGTGNLTATTSNRFITLAGNITQSGSVRIASSNAVGQHGIIQSGNTTITASSINITGSFANSFSNLLALDTSAANGNIYIDAFNGAGGHVNGGVSAIVANAGTGNVTIGGSQMSQNWVGRWAGSLTGAINISSTFYAGSYLNLTATANSSSSGPLILSANSSNTWTVSPGMAMTYAGAISDGGNASITKAGAGTLVLSNAANTYNGSTTVSAGTLAVSGNISSSAITLNTGAVVSAGNATSAAKFNAAALAIGAGTGYAFTIGNVVASVAGTDYDQIALGGALALNSTAASPFTISLYGTPTGWSGGSTYAWDIITAASQTGFTAGNFTTDFTNFGIAAGLRGGNWTFSNPTAGNIRLTYTGTGIGTSAWPGGTGSWDSGFSPAMAEGNNITYNGTGGGTSTNNISSSTLGAVGNITFSSGAGAYTLEANSGSAGFNATTALSLAGNIVNNSSNTQTINTALAFASARTVDAASGNIAIGRAISGIGGLTKNGTGTLTLSGSNTYSGGTTVNAGTLTLSGANTGGGAVMVDGATMNIQGNLTLGSGQFTVGNATAGTVNHSSGTVSITSGNGLIVGAGAASSSNGTYNLSGGVLNIAANANRGIVLGYGSNSRAAFNMGGGTLLNTGTLQIGQTTDFDTVGQLPVYNQTGGDATHGTITMGGNGQWRVHSTTTTLSITGGNFTAGNFTVLAGGTNNVANITIGGNAIVTLPAFPTSRGGGATTDLTFDGGTLRPTASSAAYLGGLTSATIRSGGAAFDTDGKNITVSQALLENAASTGGGLTKAGTGTLTLSGNNTYSGATTVNAGSLIVDGSLAAGSAVSVAGGATLGGVGTLNGPANISGILAPGNGVGTLAFGGNLTLTSTATVAMEINSNSVFDTVAVAGTLIYGGKLQLAFGYTPSVGQTYALFSGAGLGSSTGNFTLDFSANPGFGGAFTPSNGQLLVTAVPEPSAWALLLLSGLCFLGWKARGPRCGAGGAPGKHR